MKKLLFFLVLSLSTNLFCQHPTVATIVTEVRLDSLTEKIKNMTGERGVWINGTLDTIKSRNRSKPGNELAYQYYRQEFLNLGLQIDSGFFGTAGKNIFAIIPGYIYPNKPYLISAHYDVMPSGANVAPGADDDASGVSVVMEAARILRNYQFEHTIIFALWDEEEYGLIGSANYANLADANNDSIAGVVQMDAIAQDSDNDSVARVHCRPTAGNSTQIKDTVLAVNSNYNIGINMLVNSPGATYSDHASFWNRGYGAVLLIEDWDNDPNPDYHQVTDHMSGFRWPYYHKMAKIAIGTVASLAVPLDTTGLTIDELDENTKLFSYPNPTTDFIQLKWTQDYEMIELVDANGKVLESNLLISSNKNYQLNLMNYPTGIYFARLTYKNKSVSHKIVKK